MKILTHEHTSNYISQFLPIIYCFSFNLFAQNNISIAEPLVKLDISKTVVAASKNEMENQFRFYNWDQPVTNIVPESGLNNNKLVSEKWGVANRSNNKSVKLYSETDPGFNAPNGESYGIELEIGDDSVPPRSIDSKSIRLYFDAGQTGINKLAERAEYHIRSTLLELGLGRNGLKNGETLWLGWSEYYTYIDTSRHSTLMQFRNQPSLKQRLEWKAKLIFSDINVPGNGGPASAIELANKNNKGYWEFSVRKGKPTKWHIPKNNKHTTHYPIEKFRWYDFIVQITYSQKSDGRFRIWLYDTNKTQANTYSVSDKPEWDYHGPTMYEYPTPPSHLNLNSFSSPEIRWGLYRYNTKQKNIPPQPDITESNRYFVKYHGPLRLWVGQSNSGFSYVKPRD